MIIWLANYPCSGNTYFRLILHHRYGVQTHSVYDDPRLESEGIAGVVGHQRMPGTLEQLAARPELFIVKTHELPWTHPGPAIYLVRDGRDAVVSHARYLNSFAPRPRGLRQRLRYLRYCGRYLTTLDNVVKSHTPFGGWSSHVEAWRNRDDTTVFLRYEDLIEDPCGWADWALRTVGCRMMPINRDPLPAFAELRSRSPKFFRKGRAGSWRREMPNSLHRLFWAEHGRTMDRLGYHRDGSRDTYAPTRTEAPARREAA